MQNFRGYMLDEGGHIIARADIAAADLDDAKSHAFQIVQAKRERICGMEIWARSRRLFPTGSSPADPGMA